MDLKHITADRMKLMIMMQQRFGNGALICVTECGYFNSDVLVLSKNGELIEYETKISITDFKADFKKPKHQLYEHVKVCEEWDKKFSFVPHKFYFVIPEGLLTEVLPKLINKPYGVIAVSDKPFKPSMREIEGQIHMRVIKRATAIRKHNVTTHEKNIMLKRLTSELINEKINKIRKVINEEVKEE